MARAALYVRVSTDIQERWSIPAQRERLSKLADEKGYAPTLYDEGGTTGTSLEARPVILKMLRDIERGRFAAVMVTEITRLCRSEDLEEYARIIGVMKRAGCLLITPEREHDLRRADDSFAADLGGVMSKHERMRMLERCAIGRRARQDSGKWRGGPPPWGYRWNYQTREIEPDPEKQRAIELIFMRHDLGVHKLGRLIRSMGYDVTDTTIKNTRRFNFST